jgi:hypothetical protein
MVNTADLTMDESRNIQIIVNGKNRHTFLTSLMSPRFLLARIFVEIAIIVSVFHLFFAPNVSNDFTRTELIALHNSYHKDDVSVLVSYFINGRSVAAHDWVRKDGTPWACHSSKNYGSHGGGDPPAHAGTTMPESERNSLNAALRSLPLSQTVRLDADILLVSWDDGSKWNTRTYDRSQIPPEAKTLCKAVEIPNTWLGWSN